MDLPGPTTSVSPGLTTRWAPGTTRLALHGTDGVEHKDYRGEVLGQEAVHVPHCMEDS
jgi:hypothetical protein